MAGISSVLNIMREAMMVQQMAIQVTSHNIANVDTPGYTRQMMVLESNPVLLNNRLKVGLGVKAAVVVQAFDRFATQTIQQRTSALSEFESKKSVLDFLQAVFNEADGSGLTQSLQEFWSAWGDLSNNPGGLLERTILLTKATTLTERFRFLYNQLIQMKSEMSGNLRQGLQELNTLTEQVTNLNGKIVAAEAGGTRANDLRDQRNTLIEKISELTAIRTLETDDGSIMVTTASGMALVDGIQSFSLVPQGEEIHWNGDTADIRDRLSGGKIGGWLDLRDAILPQYMANLDELAGTLIYQVNQLHFNGVTLDGSTGKTFFAPNPGDDYEAEVPGPTFSGAAGAIALSADVEGIPQNIAASSASGGSGNNENALAILSLQDGAVDIRKWTYERGSAPSSEVQSLTLDDYYTMLVGDLGLLGEEIDQGWDFEASLVNQLNELRDSISGVNLDEEMVNLMKYQQAFVAASKVIAICDELLRGLMEIR
ncbi:MAG: flagellar hook-associated protein FlgK [Thermodesulfobacteriota bacterium]